MKTEKERIDLFNEYFEDAKEGIESGREYVIALIENPDNSPIEQIHYEKTSLAKEAGIFNVFNHANKIITEELFEYKSFNKKLDYALEEIQHKVIWNEFAEYELDPDYICGYVSAMLRIMKIRNSE